MSAISSHSIPPSISSHLYPSKPRKLQKSPPPIFISTNQSHVNLRHLAHLFATANLSCHRFPNFDGETGRVEPVDIRKLRIAVNHSSVVVSVFCREDFCDGEGGKEELGFGGMLMERAVPVSEKNGRLVGFGRAVSDGGLTAAIYDVAVIPSLQGLGIGRRIVTRIIRTGDSSHRNICGMPCAANAHNLTYATWAFVGIVIFLLCVAISRLFVPNPPGGSNIAPVPTRVLTSRGIYDIAALCSEKERLFFEACGFGKDALGSTTMMYTRCTSNTVEGDPSGRRTGRMLLLIPPSREPFSSEMTISG